MRLRVMLSCDDRSTALFESSRIFVSTLPRLPVSKRMARFICDIWRCASDAALVADLSAAWSLDVSPPKRIVRPL